MDRGRMRILERVMVDVMREGRRFDMRTWAFRGFDHVPCGTVACAAGWLALDPEAQATGMGRDGGGAPTFGGLSAFNALSVWLDVSLGSALALFSACHYGVPGGEVTTQMVLDRVRRVLAEGEGCLR